MSDVRLAEPADEAAIYELLTGPEGLHADNSMGFGYSADKVRERIRIATEGRGGLIGVIDGDHELAGAIGLYIDTRWYSDEVHLAEYFLFVRPVYRSRGYAALLFHFAKACRERIEAGSGQRFPLITSVVSRTRLRAKLRYWAKHAEQIGGIYVVDGGPDGVR